MKYLGKYLVVLIVLTTACGKDEFTPADRGTDYFPLRVGCSWVYDVDETIYSEVDAPQQNTYQIRLLVTDSVQNSAGSYTYIVNRTRRNPGQTTWTSLDTWSIRKNDREVIVIEGNTAFKKLMFPLRDGNTWNGNEYNTFGEDTYTVTALNASEDIEGTTFDNTLTVEQENNEDFIVFLDERTEWYAKNIGLVKQAFRQLNYCTTDNCIGQQKIKSGKVYSQVLVTYER